MHPHIVPARRLNAAREGQLCASLLTLARLYECWMHARKDDHLLTLVPCRFDSTDLTSRERQEPPEAVAIDDSPRQEPADDADWEEEPRPS